VTGHRPLIKKEILLVIVGGVFLLEVFPGSSRFSRIRCGRSGFQVVSASPSFRIVRMEETKVVIRFWILGGLFAILSLSTLKLQ
jgi:phospho-N-acetylmuramoyl-pentapeptide-transferase